MVDNFRLFSTPIWVNLSILIPVLLFIYWRRQKLHISLQILILTGIFGISFAFVEAACVIYLRAAIGLLPGSMGTLAQIQRLSSVPISPDIVSKQLPIGLLTIEVIREATTMVMLFTIACIATKKLNERVALFFWASAFWDIFYYVFLRLTIGWPADITTRDVLFMIPVPWSAQVWFPLLVCTMTLVAVFANRSKKSH